jgi:hypothetical protein
MAGFDVGGLLQMLLGGKMGGGGAPQMSGVMSGSSSTAPAPKQPGMMSQIGQGLLDAQKGGWGYGWQNALSGQQGQQGGTAPVGEGAKDKELSSLLMLLKLLQGGGGPGGMGAPTLGSPDYGPSMGGPPVSASNAPRVAQFGAGATSASGGGGGGWSFSSTPKSVIPAGVTTNKISGKGVPEGFPYNVNGRYTSGPLKGKDIQVPDDLANEIRGLQLGYINPRWQAPNVVPGLGNRTYGQTWGIVDYAYPETPPFMQGQPTMPAREVAREADLNSQLGMFGGGWSPVY